MTAKEYLNRYRRLNAYIDCKLEEAAQLRELATRLSPMAMFDRNGNVSDKVGRTAVKIVDLEREIDRDVDELVEIRSEIMRTISSVPDIEIRTMLEYRYINGWSWRKIALKMHYSEDHVTCYLHRKALKEVSEIMKINGS